MRGLALALALCAAVAGPLAAQTEPYEEGFFEVSIQRVPGRITVTTLVDAQGAVLIPLAPIVELVGIPMVAADSSLTLEWPPGPWHTVLHRTVRAIEVSDSVTSVSPREWVERGGQLYLSSAVLGRVLDAQIVVDWAGLGVLVNPRTEFPATRRLEREAQRARDRLFTERLGPSASDVPFTPRTGGVVGAWGWSLSGSSGSYRGAARASAGGSLFGGATEAGGIFAFGDGVGDALEEMYARYHRVFPRGTLLRQMEVGSVLSDGPIARRLIGGTFTNEPFTSPRFFGEALIDPVVPAGWEYEVYQGDALVGVARAGSNEELRAPLNYGNTPVRIRMIAPSGEERTEELLYVVPPTRLPAREWRYHVGGGACQDPGCESYAYGEVHAGIHSRATVGLGLDRIDPTEGRADVRPYGFLGLSPLRGVTLDVQTQPGSFFQSSLDWATLDAGSFGASYAWTRPVGDAPTLDGWYAQLSGNAPIPRLGRSFSGRIQLRGSDSGDVDSWQVVAATTVRRSYVSAELAAGLNQRALLTAQAFTPLGFGPGYRFQDLAVSTGLGVSTRGPELFQAGASFRPLETGSLSVDLHLNRGSSPSLSVGFVVRRNEGYYQVRAARGSGTGTGLFASADGSVAYDARSGVVPLPFQGLGRSGLAGTVFFDRDGDGVQDADETAAEGVDVMIRGERIHTDAGGRYRAWEILPYEVIEVAVDSLSIDPSWVPAPRSARLRPSPNLFNRIDLPLRRTRELSGQVELAGSVGRSLGGVGLELRDAEGTVVATPRTFSDGVFYIQRLAPGRYTLTVLKSSLDALGAAIPEPLSFELTPETDAPLELPPFRLEPLPAR